MSGGHAVVIVGGGHAGLEVAASLRARGHAAAVTIVGDEETLPYERPPLSKGLLSGELSEHETALRPESFFAEQAIELHSGRRASVIERDIRRVTLDDGTRLHYDHLVLATGGANRVLEVPGVNLDGVVSLRTLADAIDLRERLGRSRAIAIVGAGFIGLEVATAAAKRGLQVTVLELEHRPMTRTTTAATAAFFGAAHARDGVAIRTNTAISAIRGSHGRVTHVEDSDGHRHPADIVLVAVGIAPNDQLASAAGLPVDRGILVGPELTTADPAISAIGDCARFPSRLWTDGPVRLESVQNAADQARSVAARIAGASVPYGAVPWFWSDQAGVRLQMAGRTADADQTVVSGDPAAARFSVLCFRAGGLCGVESVGRPGDHVAARRLLGAAAGGGPTPKQAASAGFELRDYARAA